MPKAHLLSQDLRRSANFIKSLVGSERQSSLRLAYSHGTRFPIESLGTLADKNQSEESVNATFELLGGAWPSHRVSETGVTGGARVRCELEGTEDG